MLLALIRGTVTISLLLSFLACAGMFFLGLLVLFRGGRTPLARTIGVLALDMFAWNFFSMAYGYTGLERWSYLDGVFSPLTPPLVFQAVLLLVGQLRRLRWLLYGAYLGFGVLSLSNLATLVLPGSPVLVASPLWSYLFLGFWLPLMMAEVALLLRHIRVSPILEEQMRARLTLSAVAIGALFGTTEMWDHLVAVPAMGHLGTLGSMAIMAVVLFRLRLAGRELTGSVVIYSLALTVLGIGGYLLVFRSLMAHTAQAVLGTTCVTLVLLLAFRGVSRAVQARRARAQELATLGRFSAQMAHDLKNPLAALKGALQVMETEELPDESMAQQMLPLMAQQIVRMEVVVNRYQRMSRVEVNPRLLDLDVLLKQAKSTAELLAIQRKQPLEVQVTEAPSPDADAHWGDAELLETVLENLVRNALDAMQKKEGLLRLQARVDAESGRLVLSVQDNGEGMDARLLEQATDDFYSTKADGSGLGLAFSRRVMEAHGGQLKLQSVPGEGTRVELSMPASRRDSDGGKG